MTSSRGNDGIEKLLPSPAILSIRTSTTTKRKINLVSFEKFLKMMISGIRLDVNFVIENSR